MNIYDILIGNQDRHPYNWQILFHEDVEFFGPLYDNGASLGWQLSDIQLNRMLEEPFRLNRFFKNTKVKAGLFENKQPPLKAKHVLNYIKKQHPEELAKVKNILLGFDMDHYSDFIKTFPLISTIRKKFLIRLIEVRLRKILDIINVGGG